MTQTERKPLTCNACGAQIYFDRLIPKSASGKMIPQDFLRPGNAHDCPNRKKGGQQQQVNRSQLPGEDREEVIAAKSVAAAQTDYSRQQDARQERIDKAHQENLEVQRRQAQALENIAETLAMILHEMRVTAGRAPQD